MQKHAAVAVALLVAMAVPARAIEKWELARRYPTIEAAAHAFGHLDVNHTEDHALILTATFPPRPGQWSGMVTYPEEYQGEETGHIELDHAILHNGRMLANMESAFRPDITVWDDPLAKISRNKMRYRIGTVHEDLRVEVFPELRDAFPGEYVWIPCLDEVYESPFALPRVSYTRVAKRRPMLRGGNRARFATTDGGSATFKVGVVRHFGDTRRFLVANRGRQALILGEMYPFANPETHREERHYYSHEYPRDRKPEFALFNELAGFEVRDHPLEPADPTIVYGVKLYPRYLSHFDRNRGPVLRADAIRSDQAIAAAAAPKPTASPAPAKGAPVPTGADKGAIQSIPPVPEGSPDPGAAPDGAPAPDASGAPPPPPPDGGIPPVPGASGDAGPPPPPPDPSASPAANP